jgi:spore coat polysaccharide biosynthesis protein SpsF
MNDRTIAIIQARMGSTRLPGKVLLDIGGQPMLVRVVERVRRAERLDGVVVATTIDAQDDPVVELCRTRGYPFTRGSTQDVLDRYYQAAKECAATRIVRITADCPVIDPQLIDLTIDAFNLRKADFAANRLPPPWSRTYPNGLDVEVCTILALERAWKEANQPFEREHVMPYFYEGIPPESLRSLKNTFTVSPHDFRVLLVNHDPDYGALRWAVDTAPDLELLSQVYSRFGNLDTFTWSDVLTLFEREPELAKINASVSQKSGLEAEEQTKENRILHPDQGA